jgi:hypothetical protein
LGTLLEWLPFWGLNFAAFSPFPHSCARMIA